MWNSCYSAPYTNTFTGMPSRLSCMVKVQILPSKNEMVNEQQEYHTHTHTHTNVLKDLRHLLQHLKLNWGTGAINTTTRKIECISHYYGTFHCKNGHIYSCYSTILYFIYLFINHLVMVHVIKTQLLNVIITLKQMTKSSVQISGTFLIPKIKPYKLI